MMLGSRGAPSMGAGLRIQGMMYVMAIGAAFTVLSTIMPAEMAALALFGAFIVVVLGDAVQSMEHDYPRTAVGKHRYTKSTGGKTIDLCVNCNRQNVGGSRIEFGTHTVVFGQIVSKEVEGVIYECGSCAASDEIDKALRSDKYDITEAAA